MLPSKMGMRQGLRRMWLALAASGALAVAGALSASDASAQPSDARAWLGVAMERDPSGGGVRVSHVVRQSPADAAGLREGDRILRVAGTTVNRGADIVGTVGSFSAGDVIDIVFARSGVEHTARVTLGEFPAPDQLIRMDLVGTAAPAWHDVQAVSGDFPSSIDALRGRVVVLDFWATWCGPCRIVAPQLGALQARYGAQGLSVLGVSTEEAQEVAEFARRTAMRYSVAVDRHAETTRSYGVMSLPTLVVIDKRGVVRDVAVGYEPGESARLESSVRALLAEGSPRQP